MLRESMPISDDVGRDVRYCIAELLSGINMEKRFEARR